MSLSKPHILCGVREFFLSVWSVSLSIGLHVYCMIIYKVHLSFIAALKTCFLHLQSVVCMWLLWSLYKPNWKAWRYMCACILSKSYLVCFYVSWSIITSVYTYCMMFYHNLWYTTTIIGKQLAMVIQLCTTNILSYHRTSYETLLNYLLNTL